MSAGSDGWDYNDDYRLYDVVLDANNVAAYGFYHISNQAKNVGAFYNCRFTNATDSGIYMGGYNACNLYNCEADNNTNYGFRPPGSNRGNSNWYNCSLHDNGSGVWLGNATYFYSCKIYNNTNYGFFGVDRYAYENIIHNCSIYGNGSHGLYINNSSNDADKIAANKFINNTFIGNGGYGIKSNAILGINYLSYGNLFDQNTSGPYDFTGVSYEAYPNQEIIAPADFDLSTGQFNYSSNTTNSRIPWGGAIGSVSREDFSITTSGSLTFATGDVGTTVVVSGKSFQKISNSPIVWNVI
jgi:hypothetical protein